MILIVGFIVVLSSVLGGFMMAGGHVGALIHPSEFVTIGGAALGSLIVMSPKKVLIDLLHGVMASVKGSPFGRKTYEDLFKLWYELLRLARSDGLLALEKHVTSPHESVIFGKYPSLATNHHVMEFICSALTPVIERSVPGERIPLLLDAELKAMEEEHHAPLGVLSKTADALPGFGIVAAVMGIVITMGAIDGPVEEIGHKVGAALVGTFLGILLSYGFFAPLAVRMEFQSAEEMAFFHTIKAIVQGVIDELAPKSVIEQASRGLAAEVRFTREDLEALFKEVEGG
jgi:chemotaxis protein MotA